MGMTTKQILQGIHDWALQKVQNVVYDISAAHPDGQGNPTPYADLTAALGTGGVNIPEDIRKGGMSIKFIQGTVQSSDNKYVQFRYMSSSTANADFTNVANWQGVDTNPTNRSKNLVESGGVFNMTTLQEINADSTLVDYGIKADTGKVVSLGVYGGGNVNSYTISPKSIIKIYIRTANYNSAYAVAALYKNGNLVKVLSLCNDTIRTDNILCYNEEADTLKTCYFKNTYCYVSVSQSIINTKTIDFDYFFGNEATHSSIDVDSAINSTGNVITNEYTTGANVATYNIGDKDCIRLNFYSVGFNNAYCSICLYKNGNLIGIVEKCNQVISKKEKTIFNNYNADTLKVCYLKANPCNVYITPITASENNLEVDGLEPVNIAYTSQNLHIVDDMVIGETASIISNDYRACSEVNVDRLNGIIKVENVLSTVDADSSNFGALAVLSNNDEIIDVFDNRGGKGHLQNVIVNLDKYTNINFPPKKIIFNRGAVGYAFYADPVVTLYYSGLKEKVNILENIHPRKGVLLLHLDVMPTMEDINLSILEEYGFNVSWYINKYGFGGDNTFASAMGSSYHQAYTKCIKRGDDFALYPAMNAREKTETEWKNWFDTALGNLASIHNIHNVTTLACGQLSINDDILNAAKDKFKIIRGGRVDVNPGNTYEYTDENIYMPVCPSNSKLYVNDTIELTESQELDRIYSRIMYAINSNTACSFFLHGVGGAGELTEAKFRTVLDFIQSKITAGELELMTWRDYYSMVNKTDGEKWNYNRLLKMMLQS